MAGKPGIGNLAGMFGRRKGGRVNGITPRDETLAFMSEADRFLQHMKARSLAHGTVELHQGSIFQFIRWCQESRVSEPAAVSRRDLENYQLHLHTYRSPRTGKALTINTQLARLGCVRRFFARLCRDGLIPANPAADLDLPRRQPRGLPVILTPVEIESILQNQDPNSPFGMRDRAIIGLFYATGIRRSELARLDLRDYDPFSQTLHVRKGKGGRSRLLPVGTRVGAWVDGYLRESRPLLAQIPWEEALFVSGYASRLRPDYLGSWMRRQFKRAGISKPGSCHLFRHSCATHMHQAGADIRIVQEMLGHARLDTTQIYTHLDISALQTAHLKYHPSSGADFFPPSPVVEQREDVPPCEVAPPAPDAGTVTTPSQLEIPTIPRESAESNPNPQNQERIIRCPEIQSQTAVWRMGIKVYGYRYYHPELGRWLSKDPIEEDGGLHLYGFVGDDGVNQLDFIGLQNPNSPGDRHHWFPQKDIKTFKNICGADLNIHDFTTLMHGSTHSIVEHTGKYGKIITDFLQSKPDCCDVLQFVKDLMELSLGVFFLKKHTWLRWQRSNSTLEVELRNFFDRGEGSGSGPTNNSKFDELLKSKCGGKKRRRHKLANDYSESLTNWCDQPSISNSEELPPSGYTIEETYAIRRSIGYSRWWHSQRGAIESAQREILLHELRIRNPFHPAFNQIPAGQNPIPYRPLPPRPPAPAAR